MTSTPSSLTARFDPVQEIRLKGLHAARGLNFWSRRPIIRMDLAVGAYDDISSADAPGFSESLVAALPGLEEHECSIGVRGGFLQRLHDGTFAPHIIEHVALELQSMIGHEVGYGKTRGGDEPGEYTLIFEYHHEQVGLRAAAMALEIVQQAFMGTLTTIEALVEELKLMDKTAHSEPVRADVFCGVTGGTLRYETQRAISELLNDAESVVVDVAPAYILRAGLPYSRSDMAVILDTSLADVPTRYNSETNARQLVGTLVDGVRRNGTVICPAKEWELQDYARDRDCRVAIFAGDSDITERDRRVAMAVARVVDGIVVVEKGGAKVSEVALTDDAEVVPQVVAALVGVLDTRRAGASR